MGQEGRRGTERCAPHRARAGWRCARCEAWLCPDCAASPAQGLGELAVCTRCGGAAQPLKRHRRELASFAARLPQAALWLFGARGLLALGVAVLACVVGGFAGRLVPFIGVLLAIPLAIGGAAAALFAVVRGTAQGQEGVELTDFSISDVLLPALFRLTLAASPVWGAELVYAWKGPPGAPPLLLVLGWGALAAVYLPAAFIMAATDSPFLDLLNPFKVLGIAARLGRPFLLLVGVWCAVGVSMLVALGVAAALEARPIFIVTRLVELALLLAGPVVGARASGLLLYVEGDRVDYDTPERFLEPVLGDARPRGVLVEAGGPGGAGSRPESPVRRQAPIELEEDPPPVVPGVLASATSAAPPFGGQGPAAALEAPRFVSLPAAEGEAPPFQSGLSRIAWTDASGPSEAAVAAAPDASVAVRSLEVQQLEALRGSMRAGDHRGAVELWRAAHPDGLGVQELLWIAKAAAHLRLDDEAYGALARAVETPAPDPDRAQAAVVFARFLFERVVRRDEAVSWMERAAQRYPETPGGRFAAGWLAQHEAPSAQGAASPLR